MAADGERDAVKRCIAIGIDLILEHEEFRHIFIPSEWLTTFMFRWSYLQTPCHRVGFFPVCVFV